MQLLLLLLPLGYATAHPYYTLLNVHRDLPVLFVSSLDYWGTFCAGVFQMPFFHCCCRDLNPDSGNANMLYQRLNDVGHPDPQKLKVLNYEYGMYQNLLYLTLLFYEGQVPPSSKLKSVTLDLILSCQIHSCKAAFPLHPSRQCKKHYFSLYFTYFYHFYISTECNYREILRTCA